MNNIKIEKNKNITEDYCIGLINGGNALIGYGYYLAKKIVHKDSIGGWEKFCIKTGTSKNTANRQINFYLAKNTEYKNLLPEKESHFRELAGKTIEEKSMFYQDVKKELKTDTPTAKMLRIYREKLSEDIVDIVLDNGIYAISDGEYIKIGVTDNIDKRLKQLQTGNARELKLLIYREIDRAYKIEKLIHDKYKNKRLIGEWFDINAEELISYICN